MPSSIFSEWLYIDAMTDDGQLRFSLRISDDLHQKVTQAAARSGRSVNSEMLHRLEQSFEAADLSVVVGVLSGLANRLKYVEANVDLIEKRSRAGLSPEERAWLTNFDRGMETLDLADREHRAAQRPQLPDSIVKIHGELAALYPKPTEEMTVGDIDAAAFIGAVYLFEKAASDPEIAKAIKERRNAIVHSQPRKRTVTQVIADPPYSARALAEGADSPDPPPHSARAVHEASTRPRPAKKG